MRERRYHSAVLVDGMYIIELEHCGHKVERLRNTVGLYNCEECPSLEEERESVKMTPALGSNGRQRRYDICTALNMTKLSIELERLERLGVDKWIIARWKDRASHLLQDIFKVSDPL